MDGLEATKTLMAKGYDRPIIALTANALDKERDACLAAGCHGFITKPVSRVQLYENLSRYLKD